MAPSSGNPMLAPIPFKTVRRGTCFFSMNMVVSLFTPYLLALCTGGGTRRILNCSLLTTA